MKLIAGIFLGFMASFILNALALSIATAQEKHIEVPIGYSELLRLSETLESVVVGDPEIADATLISNFGIILTGKAVGHTNLIVLDEAGNETLTATLQVVPLDRRPEFRVRVIKGGSREDATLYLCGPQPGCTAVSADQNVVPSAVVVDPPARLGETSAGAEPAVVDPE